MGEIFLHKCSQCDKRFKRERGLRKHLRLAHSSPGSGSQTNTAKDSEGQETSEEISSKLRN